MLGEGQVKYARLKKGWVLRGWSDLPFAMYDWQSDQLHELGKTAFFVATSCNGSTDFESFIFTDIHRAFLHKMIQQGMVEPLEAPFPMERAQDYRMADNPQIKGVIWSVTGQCNLNCRHCYITTPDGERYGELPFSDIERLVEQFEQANVMWVVLTGGEPFMRRDILEIFRILTLKKIRISEVLTNGTLITGELLDGIRGLHISPPFGVSFDGCGSHDYMRGKKDVERRAIRGIEQILEAGFPVTVRTSLDRRVKDHVLETYSLLKKMGVHGWRIKPPAETGRWKSTSTAISPEDEAALCKELLDRWHRDGKPFLLDIETPFMHSGNQIFSAASYGCATCHFTAYIMPDATMIPCPGYSGSVMQGSMPNLLEEDLCRAWKSPRLRAIADIKLKDLLEKNDECSHCEFLAYCGMGCRARAFLESGDVMRKEMRKCLLTQKYYPVFQNRRSKGNTRGHDTSPRPSPFYREPDVC